MDGTLVPKTFDSIKKKINHRQHLLHSGLDASFLGEVYGLVDSKAVEWLRQRRFKSPRCQYFFNGIPWLNIGIKLIALWAIV